MSTARTEPQGPLLDGNEAALCLARLKVLLLLGADDHIVPLVRQVLAGEGAEVMKNLDGGIRRQGLGEISHHFNGLLRHARDNGLDTEAETLETVCRHLADYMGGNLKLVQP